jgi:hypothetical protein
VRQRETSFITILVTRITRGWVGVLEGEEDPLLGLSHFNEEEFEARTLK